MLKKAYEAGVIQAMIDAGLLKESQEVYTGQARPQDTQRMQDAQARLQAAEKRVSAARSAKPAAPAAPSKPFDFGSAIQGATDRYTGQIASSGPRTR